nr:hypothetical protein [Synechococcus sp. A15-127]
MRDTKTVLGRNANNHWNAMDIEALKGFEIRLDTRTTRQIVSSNSQS